MVSSNDTRLLVVGVAALCLSGVIACTGMVTGTDGSSSNGSGTGTSTGTGTTNGDTTVLDTKGVDPGASLIHRLNTAEYNNTVKDVLGTSQQPGTAQWAAEETADFDDIAAVMDVDDKQYQLYYNAAGVVAGDVFSNAALKSQVVTCETADDNACVQGIINATGLKIFRRPLSADEVGTYQKVYTAARAATLSHDDSLQQVLIALLSSAEFLYRMEFDPTPSSTTPHALSGYELASRLSYFLWQSAPDAALLKVAADNSISKTDVLSAAVDRLSADAKYERFTQSFIGQWLGIRNVATHGVTASDFPAWTPALGQAMATEVYSFFDEFAKGSRPWTDFITADVNYVNSDLAKMYGMPAVPAGMTERVQFTTDNRFGFLGMGAFLALSSYEYRTAPTLRGRWILLNLLCTPPKDPPPGVPALDADPTSTSAAQQNVRARLEAHRASPICASCHASLDPYGLALENFDAIGEYRATYPDGSVIDASTSMPDGTTFSGLSGLANYVAGKPDLLQCVEQQLFTYSLGREINDTDQPYLAGVRQTWTKGTPSIPALIKGLVTADTFRMRHGG
jgi:Protein of unknown function (DUF1592)/Protein of unknown function (DUF1588)/Protein of unknown function (DUF1595)/Protein of unknown function (DUF1585)/Protein of unknown function (DUF1587)